MKSLVTSLLILFSVSLFAFDGRVTIKYKTYNKVADNYEFLWKFSGSKCLLEMNRKTTEKTAPTYLLPDAATGKLIMFAKDDAAKEKNYYALNVGDINGGVSGVTGQATGEKRNINGLDCEKYTFQNGTLTCEAWVAKSIAVNWTNIAPFFKTSLEIQGLASLNVSGFPVAATTKDERGLIINNYELTNYSAGKVDEAEVSIPAGYTLYSPKK